MLFAWNYLTRGSYSLPRLKKTRRKVQRKPPKTGCGDNFFILRRAFMRITRRRDRVASCTQRLFKILAVLTKSRVLLKRFSKARISSFYPPSCALLLRYLGIFVLTLAFEPPSFTKRRYLTFVDASKRDNFIWKEFFSKCSKENSSLWSIFSSTSFSVPTSSFSNFIFQFRK